MKLKSLLSRLAMKLIWHSPDFRRTLDDLIRLRVDEGILKHKAKVNPEGHPGLGFLWDEAKDIDLLRTNVKQLGLQMARLLYRDGKVDPVLEDRILPLTSRICRQDDFAEPWFRSWCKALHLEPILHRKIWEYAFVLQAMHENNVFRNDSRGIGFGCGEEPIASYLASRGVSITVTDLAPEKSDGLGWVGTGQHTSSLQQAYYPDLISLADFEKRVELEYVDMNDIPASMSQNYDFCWSICALEHLGSIRKGLDFIINSMNVLRPGGVAIHTTEFNLSNEATIDNWQTVLFQHKHFLLLADELKAMGYEMLSLNADAGNAFLDRFIDLPPYDWDEIMKLKESAHLKVAIDGFPSTCVGIIVKKP